MANYVQTRLLNPVVGNAIAFALEAHNYQVRKGSSAPYVCHPIEVMNKLLKANVIDPNILCAAVLHDVIEDTDTTIDEVSDRFGELVARIVLQLSEGDYAPGVAKPPKKERKQAYIDRVVNCPEDIRQSVQLISAVDKLCNALDYLEEGGLPDALSFWFYGELMPTYLSALTPYQRLYKEMKNTWEKLLLFRNYVDLMWR